MHQKSTTYSTIVSFLFAIGLILLVLFLVRIYFKSKLENQIVDSSKVQFNHEVNALVEMNYSMMAKTVYDYSFWDEFVIAIEHKDTSWCRSNITLINTFKYDYICIYNNKFDVLCEFDNVGGQFRNLIPKGTLNSFRESQRPQFFLMTRLGLMEMTYTSIHPTFDVKHDKTQPAGYLYVGRRWDNEFLANLTKIIGAPAHFASGSDVIKNKNSKFINAQIALPGWDGKVIGIIVFTRALNHSFNATQNAMYIAILVALTILLIVNAFARKYIHRPLKLITEILKSENKDYIVKLKEYPAEFGRIGDLFEKFVTQKNEFEKSKQRTEESAEQLKAIFENSLDAIRISKNGRTVLFNQAYINLFGYEDGNELIGRHVLEHLLPSEHEKVESYIQLRLEVKDAPTLYESIGVRKNGEEFPFEVKVGQYTLNNEKYTIAILRDISERKQAVDMLESSLSLLQATLESTADGILVIDQNGKVTQFNQKFAEMWQIPEELLEKKIDEQLLNNVISKLVDPEKFISKVYQLYERPGESSFDKFTLMDGRIFERYSQPQKIGSNIVGRVWSFRDITESKRAEEALLETQLIYRAMVEQSNDGITIANIDGRYSMVNEAFCKMTGYTEDELLNMRVFDLFLNEPQKKLFIQVAELGVKGTKEFELVRKDGSLFLASVSATSLEINNKRYVQGIVRDVTERIRSMEALKQSEDKFRKAFYTNPDSIVISRLNDGKIVSVNKGFTQIMEYTEAEVIGKTSSELNIWSNPEDRETLKNCLKKDGFIDNFEAIFCSKSGELGYGLMSAAIIEIDGEPHTINITRDIRIRKRIEEELIYAKNKAEESEEQLRAIFDNSKDAIGISQGGTTVMVNHTYLTMFGYEDQNEIIGKSILDQISPKEHDRIKQFVAKRNVEVEIPSSYETIGIRKNGDEFPFEVNVSTYSLNNQKYSVGIIRDITERKQAEDALLQKTTLFEALLNTTMDSILIIDKNGKKVFQNERTVELFNIPREYADNINDQDQLNYVVSVNKNPEQFVQKVLYLYDHPEETSEDELELKNGKILHRYSAPVLSKDKYNYGRIWMFRDITASKQAEHALLIAKEKAEESDRLKTAFLQNMSHEIRTPMNAIMGFSGILNKYAHDEIKLKKYTSIISQRCQDLLDIINDILDIAKIESGQLSVNIEVCNLHSLFEELTSFFDEYKYRIEKQHIKFSLKACCEPSESIIFVDIGKLKQIFINLISNSFKFTNEGVIEGGCRFDKNHNLVFYVSDTGIGIPTDKQQLVFERFSQVDQGINRLYGGTGLGLSIVKGLVELLGCELFLESEPGKGSTFSFTIPYKTSQIAENR